MRQYITVGVHDWQNFAQDTDFYPEDLPLEWKLGYYANEFDCACIGLNKEKLQTDLLREWVQDLPEQFKLSFYLERSDQFSILCNLLVEESCNIDSVIVNQRSRNILLQFERLKTLSYELGCSPGMDLIEQTAIWSPENLLDVNCRIAHMPEVEDMRQYRNWINQWMQTNAPADEKNDFTLWLPGTLTDYKKLTEVRMLVEMMGY